MISGQMYVLLNHSLDYRRCSPAVSESAHRVELIAYVFPNQECDLDSRLKSLLGLMWIL